MFTYMFTSIYNRPYLGNNENLSPIKGINEFRIRKASNWSFHITYSLWLTVRENIHYYRPWLIFLRLSRE